MAGNGAGALGPVTHSATCDQSRRQTPWSATPQSFYGIEVLTRLFGTWAVVGILGSDKGKS